MDTRSQEWIDQTSLKIKEAFDIFDKDKKEVVLQEEIGSIMRYLGAYPSERTLVLDILPTIQDDDNIGTVPFKKFKKKMLQILADKQYQPDNRDTILQAFRTLDSHNKGLISMETMESYLLSNGTPFTSSELESFFLVAKDTTSDDIYYEDYVSLFPKDVY